jgi:hypothetical protein
LDDVEIDRLASDVHLEIAELVIIPDFNLFKQWKFVGFGKISKIQLYRDTCTEFNIFNNSFSTKNEECWVSF